MKRLILPALLLLCLFSAANYVAAQPDASPTPSVTPNRTLVPLLTRAESEMLFPAAVRFSVTANVPFEDVSTLYLRIYQPDGALNIAPLLTPRQHGIPLDAKTALFTYVWEFTPEEAPMPFTPLRFEWQVQSTEGLSVASGEFLFQDTLRNAPQPVNRWQSIGTTLQLYSHNADLALDLLHQNAMRVFELVAQQTDVAPSQRIVIYDPDVTFCLRNLADVKAPPYIESRTIGGTRRACDPNAALAIYERYGFTLLRRQTLALNELQDRLTDLIVSRAYAVLWENAPPIPEWFKAGLAQLYNTTPNSSALGIVRERLRTNRPLLTLPELTRLPESSNASEQRLWQAQSYLLTLYMAERVGAQAPFAFGRALAEAQDFESAFQTFFGVNVATFYAEWQAWLRTERAERAVRWTPYLETTPTPTFTATITPTRTPLPPRASPTPLPTITPARFPTNTPFVTATFTALPPGSLRRPTPTPTPIGGNPCGSAPLTMLLPMLAALAFQLSRYFARRAQL
ncbi:MAG: hypothetical protein NZ571_12950 [Anaerolineae bacterium]|nr:hypothetical protein [Anaerolineae bacterium]